MLGRNIVRFGQHLTRTLCRRVNTMPDPYRETYKSAYDPIVISGVLLLTIPPAWMIYDSAFEVDKGCEPKWNLARLL